MITYILQYISFDFYSIKKSNAIISRCIYNFNITCNIFDSVSTRRLHTHVCFKRKHTHTYTQIESVLLALYSR